MTANENQFKGDPATIASINIDAPITGVTQPLCDYFFVPFGQAAEQARANGDANASAVHDFLCRITSLVPSFDTPDSPFIPRSRQEGTKWPSTDDLSDADIRIAKEMANLTQNTALRARLLDLAWNRLHDHAACGEAAELYLKLAQLLNAPDHWARSIPHFKRALQLASRLGRNKSLFKNCLEAVKQAVIDAGNGATADFRCHNPNAAVHGIRRRQE